LDVLHDQIRDYIIVEAIVDLRDTRCLPILNSLAVDVLLGSGFVVEKWVTPFDEVGFRYYATAMVGAVQPGHYSADALGTYFDDQSSEFGLFDGRHG